MSSASFPETARKAEADFITEARAAASMNGSRVAESTPKAPLSTEAAEAETLPPVDDSRADKTDASPRVLRWMVSPLLKSFTVENVPDPDEFWKFFWELIRCHYILWMKHGVAHGDISVSNMMIQEEPVRKVILVDFDLAGIVQDGQHPPEQHGNQRTGTNPFMASRLLKEFNTQRPARTRQELVPPDS